MAGFSDIDRGHMAHALQLAEKGRYSAHPNPTVGCVIVRDGAVVGEGWHVAAGEAHAEAMALAAAGERASGATVYVTLEPCSHCGRTPPCTTALVEAGVAEVVAATHDPNPAVSGFDALRAAGIRVRSGLLEAEANAAIRGFSRRVTTGRPFVRVKIAAGLDGRTAMASGQSQWITGREARADVQRLRAASGAIMTGIGTVLADDPSLTVRDATIPTRGRQPLRAVLDNALRMPLSAEMLTLPGETLVYCIDDARRAPLADAGAEIVRVASRDGRVDLGEVLDDLGRRQVNELLVEAGPALNGALLAAGMVDELVLYQAPHIMGSETIGMFSTPAWTELGQRRQLVVTDFCSVGDDMRITARPEGG